MTFTKWLFEQHYRSDLVGEFSKACILHRGWPLDASKLAYRVFLHQEAATPLALHTFHVAYQEWEYSKHLPSVNMIPVSRLSFDVC